MFARTLSTLLAATTLLASTPAGALPPPPMAKHTPYSAFNHNGFLMRLSLGFG